ncbi:MAG TPA: aldehyde dehydrogenase family protein [Aquabacterium sp.]|uniref:aldehyde dehydrogenase family protein n=1 Tax=Aquabacterium sp. TaxID=1872578 RepID=UPI002E36B32B|nr:aldehyde dehydrogenase family protein [Aquabacterium sp.]HEX5371425.1 aldehyde dehydrogenase family protein [Aquabacterium sp.]
MTEPLIQEADPARLQAVFASQQATALAWRTSTAAERIARIQRLVRALMDHREALYEAFAVDFRKSTVEVDSHELLPVLAEAQHAVSHLGRWMRPRPVWSTLISATNSAWLEVQPRGRSLIIAPWNFPLNLSLGPLVSALAAGNPVILKPSEMTPQVSAVMARIVEQAFEPHEVALFEGALATSQALLALPFDHVFFTGSPQVGKAVMAAASQHLASVTLELGGKSPMIVDESADLRRAAENIMWGKLINSGQVCLAVDHVFVHERVKEALIAQCLAVLREGWGHNDEAIRANPALTRIVNAHHTLRLARLLDGARAQGARVLCGGQVDLQDCYVAPTLLDQVPDHARIMQEEIFGPLLPIVGYRSLDEVIERINRGPKPLALYMWSSRHEHIQAVKARTSSGGMCINHCVLHSQHGNLPFGGVNHSGQGASHGRWGFMAFSHERAVLKSWRLMLARWLTYQPMRPWKHQALRGIMRWLQWRVG